MLLFFVVVLRDGLGRAPQVDPLFPEEDPLLPEESYVCLLLPFQKKKYKF